jgi:uncharacterized protein YqeY
MSLKSQIETDIKKAMLAKQKEELKALRAIKSMILLAETEKGSSGSVSEDAEMKMLMKAIKQRKDSAAIYQEQGRKDLFDVEMAEVSIIERYLPQQLSAEELEAEIAKIIEQVGATSPKDMGKVMGMANKVLAGRADGKTISTVVKEMLGNS